MDELDKIDIKKKKLLECLEDSKGIVSHACKKAGVSRASFYVYMDTDEEFAKEVGYINEAAIDHVESKLLDNIDSGMETSIIFFLKTRGRKRGYSEKEHIDPAKAQNNELIFTIRDPAINEDTKLDIGGADEETV